ncbi:MAG: DNA polymerase I [Desulfovibrionaceae bacterium]|nr:DNA polymerase I [Desulfovibrionaceae bacterium]
MSLKERLHLDQDPVFLVDGTSFLYRGFYAYPDLKRSDGFPTNAIFIVLRILTRILREERPKYLGFFMDGPGPTFRHRIYDKYKAQRPKMPEPLAQQIEPLQRAVPLLGLSLSVPDQDLEADDLIAALCRAFKGRRPVVIAASDKDLKQCLDQNVFLWDPGTKKDTLLGIEDFEAETGISPGQWPDFQALTGDPSDNIPGVPGVGAKTALKILKDFPSLEALRERADELPDRLRQKVEPELDNVFLYRELTRLKTDCAGDRSLDDFLVRPADPEALAAFLKAYEFHSLLRELVPEDRDRAEKTRAKTDPTKTAPAKTGPVQGLLLAEPGPPKDLAPLAVREAKDVRDLPEVSGAEVGLAPMDGFFLLGLRDREWRFTGSEQDLARALSRASLLAAPSVIELLRRDACWRAVPLGAWFDLGLAAYLLDPEERNYSWERLRRGLLADQTARPQHPEAHGLAALGYKDLVLPRLKNAGLLELMRDLETPLIPVLADMESAGVGVDRKAFSGFLDEVSRDIEALTAKICGLAGREFNIRSSQQAAEVLFKDLGLRPAGKTPGGALSTSNQVLERLAAEHPIVEHILEYRKLEKLRSTYLEPLPRLVDETGRVHTHFNQLATATGRLSSSGPNLQNIPIRGVEGSRMRACFIAGPGMLLAAADYSQIELRVLAHFSRDPALIEAFRNDEDIHARTAALLFEVDAREVTPDQRRSAKTINFGLIYGMGPQKLARELKTGLATAKEFIERYFAKLSTLKEFYETLVDRAADQGFVTTLAGRRRLLPELNSRNQQLVSQARRQAVNTVIQGSAADIIKTAMIRAHADQGLRDLSARLILQVHDELLVEAPEKNARAAGERLKQIMQSVFELEAPLKVDLGLGRTWAEAH